MKLVIAEKPSVAQTIAKVIGATKKKEGYYEGGGYRVSWCIGHLVQMSNPETYDERYKRWNLDDLPIIPSHYRYEVSKKTKQHFQLLKKLMNKKDTKSLINACDAGREGESIFRLVYNQAQCKKFVERLWISSMEDKAIEVGFKNLKDSQFYDELFESSQARAIADWLVGMNLSRLYSCLYRQPYSVGRVQTPTLAMIVKRDDEILQFKKQKYYTVEVMGKNLTLSTERLDEKMIAQLIMDLVGDSLQITESLREEEVTRPELPFDLTSLQRECNHYFGYSAQKTLDLAQSLYEKKYITYPRTDSRYLTEDMLDSIVNGIIGMNDFDESRLKIVFDSKKVSDHHAIIPTVSSLTKNISRLSEEESQVYYLIGNKLHASVGYPLVEEKRKIIAKIEDFTFVKSWKVIVDEGFTRYLRAFQHPINDQSFLDLNVGDVISVHKKEIKEKYTKPVQHFTEESLLKAMEMAGKEGLQKGIEVERKGLGTPATRAGIIENLIFKGLVERDRKYLLATHKGVGLITVVSDTFKSATTTSKWEMELTRIAQGKATKEEFLRSLEEKIKSTIQQYQQDNVKAD